MSLDVERRAERRRIREEQKLERRRVHQQQVMDFLKSGDSSRIKEFFNTLSPDYEHCSLYMHTAVEANFYEAVDRLLFHRVDPNIRDPNNLTPLHKAVTICPRLVKLFLYHGGDPTLKDNEGNSCVEPSKEFESRMKPGVKELLVEYMNQIQ